MTTKELAPVTSLKDMLTMSPSVAEGWDRLWTAVRRQTSLPGALREMIILRVAALNGDSVEFEAHVAQAELAGLAPEKVEALRGPLTSDCFRFDEAVVLQLTDSMTRCAEAPDCLLHELRQLFCPREVVEIVATIATCNLISRFFVPLRVTH